MPASGLISLTAVASTWAAEWRNTSNDSSSLSVKILTEHPSSTVVERLDITPSIWPATAALPKPGPIAEATSNIVDPSVISSTIPSGKVTLTWDILLTPHHTLKTLLVF